MRNRTFWTLALLLAASAAMVGCCAEETVEAEPVAAPPPKPAPKPAPKPMPCEPAGTARTMTVLPSRDPACGVIRVTKTAPDTVIVGAEFDYVIKLTNVTKAVIEGVMLKEKLDQNFRLTGTNPKSTIDGQTLHWNVGAMKPGETRTFTIRGSAAGAGPVSACTDVTYENPRVCLAIKAVQPTLQITKAGPDQVLLCDPITYKITVKNTGSGNACDVVVTDDLPDGVATMNGQKSVKYRIGALAPGQSRDFTIQAKASKTGTFTNNASVAASGGLAATSNGVTTKVTKPELKVVKAGPNLRYVGRPADYTITVTNTGDGPARNTVLTDQIPAGTTLVKASNQGTASGGKVTWSLGTIAPGASKNVSLTLRMSQTGTVRNVATAQAYCASGQGATTTEVKGVPAILLECVDLADPIEVGGNETYVITVTNQGSAVGTNIVIATTLPAEQTYVSSNGPTKAKAEGKKVTFAPLASLAPKAKATYRVVVKASAAGDVRFGVQLTSDQMDSPASETESTHQYE